MSSKTLYVKVANKGTQQFYRCGILFTLIWLKVIVDLATAARLQEEQMLEVSETEPEDYVAPEQEAEIVDLEKGAAEKAAAEAAEKAAAEAAEKAAADAAGNAPANVTPIKPAATPAAKGGKAKGAK